MLMLVRLPHKRRPFTSQGPVGASNPRAAAAAPRRRAGRTGSMPSASTGAEPCRKSDPGSPPGQAFVKLQQVSESCFAVLNEKNRVCDANSGLVNRGGGLVVDTQSDLSHGRQMIELFGRVWPALPRRVVNTHEDGDHVWGNQLFEGAEIIAHRTVAERMPRVAEPKETQQLARRRPMASCRACC